MSSPAKLTTNIDGEILSWTREVATAKNLSVDAIVELALRNYLSNQEATEPRDSVMKHHSDSIAEYREVYKKLAQ